MDILINQMESRIIEKLILNFQNNSKEVRPTAEGSL